LILASSFFLTPIDLIIIANIYIIGIKNIIGIHHLNDLDQHSIVRRHVIILVHKIKNPSRNNLCTFLSHNHKFILVLHNTKHGRVLVALAKVKSKIFSPGVFKNKVFHFIFFCEFNDINNSKSLLKSLYNARCKQ
jgi:hypothetical protein